MHYTDTLTRKEAEHLGIINSEGLGFVKPQTAFKNITEQLLAELKKENLVWRKGWRSGVIIKGKTYGAQNYETQRPYTGGNAFFINMQNLLNGTNYNFFLTPKQIAARGGTIKKGAKPFPVSVFIKNIKTTTVIKDGNSIDVNTEERGVIWYHVFPIDLVENLKPIIRKTLKPDTFNEIIVAEADKIIELMPKAPPIKHGGDRAYYAPTPDYVQMPHKKAFGVQQEYYSVLFHELIHSTGSKKRLDRDLTGKFGDKSYAGEELIAEIGAAFLCGVCEIEYFTVNNSAAYLKGWAKTVTQEISNDPNFLKRSVFKAARAANFIIGKTLEKHGQVKNTSVQKTEALKAKNNKYFINTTKDENKIKFEEVIGEPVIIEGLNEFDFFIFKDKKAWGLTEASSGILIASSIISKGDAIATAKRRIESNGVDVLKTKVNEKILKFGLSPRYTKEYKKTSNTINPDKSVKASVTEAIKQLVTLDKYKKYGEMFLGVFYATFKDADFIESTEGKLKVALFKKHDFDLLEFEEGYNDKLINLKLTDSGKEMIKNISGRLETLKAKKSGTDLFPELAGVTDAVLIFVNAFLGTHDKTITKEDLVYMLATFQAAIKSGVIKAKHPLAVIANQTQDKLVSVINKLSPNEKIKLHISNKTEIENKIAGLQGLGFWHIIASAVVGKSAEYLAMKALKKKAAETPTTQGLNGIEGFTRADKSPEIKAPDTFRLNGELGKLLGDIQAYKYSIVLTGDPHAGKTEVTMQLANGFSDIGKTVGAFMLEQGGLESKDTKAAIERNIIAKNQQNVYITGEAPKGIDSIKEFANKFNVIIIDSWQKLGIPSTKFDSLRHEFPNTIFIVIFQQNGEGGTRGGVSADYDTPVHLKVHKVDSTFENNFVEVKKNRGNSKSLGLKYMVKSKKTIAIE